MKTNKLVAAGLLALSMTMAPVASLINAMPVMAEETVTNPTQHDYRAYQIFNGAQDDTGTLGNIDWGKGVDGPAILTELAKEGSVYANCTSAKDVAEVVAGFGEDSAEARAFAQVVSKHINNTEGNFTVINADTKSTPLDAGYYLLVDQTNLSTHPDDVKGLSLLQLTKKDSVQIKLKTGKPTVSKKVEDEKDGTHTGNNEKEYYDSADHEIGEVFNFKLTAQIPNEPDMNEYKTYKVVFHDTLSTGLVRDVQNEDNAIVSVKVNDTVLGTDEYTVTNDPDDGDTFDLTIADIIPHLGQDKSLQGAQVEVVYRAKLTSDATVSNTEFKQNNKVVLEYSNNPNVNGSGDTGKGPEDTVFVGTYELPNIKKDGTTEGNPALLNAGFKLGNAGKTKWAKFDSDSKLIKWVDDIKDATEILSGTDGKFAFKGLDTGTYTLRETTTPAGFNTAPDQTITLEAKHEESTATKENVKLQLTIKNGNETVDRENVIMNYKGSTLPETGGMGTTMIYGAGALMVAGAAVVYVTNKRTRKE